MSATWHQNLRDAVLLDPLIIAHGNVKDTFPVTAESHSRLPPQLKATPYVGFDVWMALELERMGFPIVLIYDPADCVMALRGEMLAPFRALATGESPAPSRVDGASPPAASASTMLPRSTTSAPPKDGWLTRLEERQTPSDFLRLLYERVFPRADARVAVICRFSDRYLSFTDRQSEEERRLSLLVQKAAMSIPATASSSRLMMVFDTEGSVPQELLANAPFSRSVLIPRPTSDEREQFIRDNHQQFDRSDLSDRFDPAVHPEHLRLIANLSEGLHYQDLLSLVSLSRREKLGLGPKQVKPLLDRFRFGTRDNAWLRVDAQTLRTAKEQLQKRVKGQQEVIDEVVPVLIRAKLGITDIGGSRHSSKPRGAFFFVGPTGVGKTELSKAIAELIFGDEKALLRYDMSEYSEEHQQARLIGAPPGYVGFDQGGQLTNAIHEKPFSVVLFDEIEKAHGRILDKFLQILDDGRLTDGMGRTVYFSESILIFTSNLGTSPSSPKVGPEVDTATTHSEWHSKLSLLPYDELCQHFRSEVRQFFVNRLGRPEILNRIGEDNVLVFRFLTDDSAKTQIVDEQIRTLNNSLQRDHRVSVYCNAAFRRLLMVHPNGFGRNGARGVRNLLSRLVLNPLAEQFFLEPEKCEGKTFKIDYRVALDEITENAPITKSALRYEWVTQ